MRPMRLYSNPLSSGGPVSLPVVGPRLPFYGLKGGAPGAEAGHHRPVGAEQDQDVRVRAVQGVAGGQARFVGRFRPSDQAHGVCWASNGLIALWRLFHSLLLARVSGARRTGLLRRGGRPRCFARGPSSRTATARFVSLLLWGLPQRPW